MENKINVLNENKENTTVKIITLETLLPKLSELLIKNTKIQPTSMKPRYLFPFLNLNKDKGVKKTKETNPIRENLAPNKLGYKVNIEVI